MIKTLPALFARALTRFGLALPPAPVKAADTPAVAVVRQYLADRAAGKAEAAYALLSVRSRRVMTWPDFKAGVPPPLSALRQAARPESDPSASAVFGLWVLLGDTHNTLHYMFTVLGPDPADPNAVLVHAVPPVTVREVSAATVYIVTARSAGHKPVLDSYLSLKRTSPRVFRKADYQ